MMKSVPLHRVNGVLILSILICLILFYVKKILIFIAFSMLLAMLMNSVGNKMEEKGIKRIWSTIICLFIVILVFLGIIWLIFFQIASFYEDLPGIQQKLEKYLYDLQKWIQEKFSVSPEHQIEFIKQQAKGFVQSAGSFFKSFLTGFAGTIGSTLVIFVFMFLMLLERERYKNFFLKIYKGDKPEEARIVLEKVCKVSQNYLCGRLTVICVLGFIGAVYSIPSIFQMLQNRLATGILLTSHFLQ